MSHISLALYSVRCKYYMNHLQVKLHKMLQHEKGNIFVRQGIARRRFTCLTCYMCTRISLASYSDVQIKIMAGCSKACTHFRDKIT